MGERAAAREHGARLTVQCATSVTVVGSYPQAKVLILLVSALGLEPRTP